MAERYNQTISTDSANVGFGEPTPTYPFHFGDKTYFANGVVVSASVSAPESGALRYNSGELEAYDGSNWNKASETKDNGTVTQGTSNSTSVTLNNLSGVITMFGTVAAVTSEKFTLTNSTIDTTSIVLVTAEATTSADVACSVAIDSVASGSVDILITNHDGSNATSAAPKIHFYIINP